MVSCELSLSPIISYFKVLIIESGAPCGAIRHVIRLEDASAICVLFAHCYHSYRCARDVRYNLAHENAINTQHHRAAIINNTELGIVHYSVSSGPARHLHYNGVTTDSAAGQQCYVAVTVVQRMHRMWAIVMSEMAGRRMGGREGVGSCQAHLHLHCRKAIYSRCLFTEYGSLNERSALHVDRIIYEHQLVLYYSTVLNTRSHAHCCCRPILNKIRTHTHTHAHVHIALWYDGLVYTFFWAITTQGHHAAVVNGGQWCAVRLFGGQCAWLVASHWRAVNWTEHELICYTQRRTLR